MKKIVIAFALSIFSLSAFAADQTGHFFGAIDAGKASVSNGNPGGQNFPSSGALRIAGGYHYNPILSVEAAYTVLGDASLAFGGGSGVTAKNSALSVAAVGAYPLNESFDLIGKLGVARNTNKLNTTGVVNGYSSTTSQAALTYGIGVQYAVNNQVAIRAQYEKLGDFTYTNSAAKRSWKTGASMFSVGAAYNF